MGEDGSEIWFHHALHFLPMTFLVMAIGDDAKTVGSLGIQQTIGWSENGEGVLNGSITLELNQLWNVLSFLTLLLPTHI